MTDKMEWKAAIQLPAAIGQRIRCSLLKRKMLKSTLRILLISTPFLLPVLFLASFQKSLGPLLYAASISQTSFVVLLISFLFFLLYRVKETVPTDRFFQHCFKWRKGKVSAVYKMLGPSHAPYVLEVNGQCCFSQTELHQNDDVVVICYESESDTDTGSVLYAYPLH